jgi:hypothetical protein
MLQDGGLKARGYKINGKTGYISFVAGRSTATLAGRGWPRDDIVNKRCMRRVSDEAIISANPRGSR